MFKSFTILISFCIFINSIAMHQKNPKDAYSDDSEMQEADIDERKEIDLENQLETELPEINNWNQIPIFIDDLQNSKIMKSKKRSPLDFWNKLKTLSNKKQNPDREIAKFVIRSQIQNTKDDPNKLALLFKQVDLLNLTTTTENLIENFELISNNQSSSDDRKKLLIQSVGTIATAIVIIILFFVERYA